MKRRLFLRNAVTGALTLTAAGAVTAAPPSAAVFATDNKRTDLKLRKDKMGLRTDRLKANLGDAVKINYKGRSFNVSRSQQAAFNKLNPALRAKLNVPKKGQNILSVRDLNELNNVADILKKHGEVASTVMCPW